MFPPLEPVWIDGVGFTSPICACVTQVLPDLNPGSMGLFVPVSGDIQSLTPPFIRSTPAPLPGVGAALAYGFSRRLRQRIRDAKVRS